ICNLLPETVEFFFEGLTDVTQGVTYTPFFVTTGCHHEVMTWRVELHGDLLGGERHKEVDSSHRFLVLFHRHGVLEALHEIFAVGRDDELPLADLFRIQYEVDDRAPVLIVDRVHNIVEYQEWKLVPGDLRQQDSEP